MLMMLSSTISTLIGGTELSSTLDRPVKLRFGLYVSTGGDRPLDGFPGVGLRVLRGREVRPPLDIKVFGVGGPEPGLFTGGASAAGGVGRDGGGGASWR